MHIEFVAGFGPILRDQTAGSAMYTDTLGLSLEREDDGYYHTERLPGVKHFALWPLAQAAQSCFGTEVWPADVPVPQAWIEFHVEDVAAATRELTQRGCDLLVAEKEEPWGQLVTRFLGPEGILIGITYMPSLRATGEGSS